MTELQLHVKNVLWALASMQIECEHQTQSISRDPLLFFFFGRIKEFYWFIIILLLLLLISVKRMEIHATTIFFEMYCLDLVCVLEHWFKYFQEFELSRIKCRTCGSTYSIGTCMKLHVNDQFIQIPKLLWIFLAVMYAVLHSYRRAVIGDYSNSNC